MKNQRWYEITIVDGVKTLNVYDQPYKSKSQSSSCTRIEDLSFYRNAFKLSKIWGE